MPHPKQRVRTIQYKIRAVFSHFSDRKLGLGLGFPVFTGMEEITEAVNNINISDLHKKNRIQVSNTKKPLFFYVNLAKVTGAFSLSCCVCFLCYYFNGFFNCFVCFLENIFWEKFFPRKLSFDVRWCFSSAPKTCWMDANNYFLGCYKIFIEINGALMVLFFWRKDLYGNFSSEKKSFKCREVWFLKLNKELSWSFY